MPTEMWSAYPPEVNSSRWEMGTGPATWVAAAGIWTEFAALVMASAASLSGEIAVMTGTTVTGLTSTAMLTSSVPFLAWMGAMEGIALINALACSTVAQAWGVATTGIIPAPVVTQNRITEGIAEATNFFGVNTPIIAELNREYAQFWMQDAMSMMTYDEAVSLATMPKLAPPPPTIPGAQTMSAAVDSAVQMGAETAQQVSQQALEQTTQGGQELGQNATQGSSQMMSQMMGMAGQLPQQFGQMMQPMGQMFQQVPQQFSQLLSQFMGGSQSGGGLGDSFALGDLNGMSGGLPMFTGGGSGIGGGIGSSGGGGPLNMSLPSGGGGGGGSAINTALGSGSGMAGPMNAMSGQGDRSVRNAVNLSGVPAPTMGSGATSNMGNGMAPMGGAPVGGAGNQGGSGSRKLDTILAADTGSYTQTDSRQERKLFS